jgi:calcium-dependent protein kinase
MCTKVNSSAVYAVKVFRTGDPEIVGTIKQTFHNNRLLHESPLIIQSYDLFIDEKKKVSHWVMEYCHFSPLEKLIGSLKPA